jgi:hypothetical protein
MLGCCRVRWWEVGEKGIVVDVDVDWARLLEVGAVCNATKLPVLDSPAAHYIRAGALSLGVRQCAFRHGGGVLNEDSREAIVAVPGSCCTNIYRSAIKSQLNYLG